MFGIFSRGFAQTLRRVCWFSPDTSAVRSLHGGAHTISRFQARGRLSLSYADGTRTFANLSFASEEEENVTRFQNSIHCAWGASSAKTSPLSRSARNRACAAGESKREQARENRTKII